MRLGPTSDDAKLATVVRCDASLCPHVDDLDGSAAAVWSDFGKGQIAVPGTDADEAAPPVDEEPSLAAALPLALRSFELVHVVVGDQVALSFQAVEQDRQATVQLDALVGSQYLAQGRRSKSADEIQTKQYPVGPGMLEEVLTVEKPNIASRQLDTVFSMFAAKDRHALTHRRSRLPNIAMIGRGERNASRRSGPLRSSTPRGTSKRGAHARSFDELVRT